MWGFRWSSSARGVLAAAFWLGTSLVSPSCDESLPPRDDPQGYLHASLSVDEGVVVVADDGSVSRAGVITIRVKNSYNEVLQAQASLRVDVKVWLRDAPGEYAEVQLDERSLITTWLVRGKLTTLPPDSTGALASQWNHRTVSSDPFWSFVRLTPKTTKNGMPFCESDPVELVAQASVRLFKSVAPVETGPVQFTLVYQIYGIQCN